LAADLRRWLKLSVFANFEKKVVQGCVAIARDRQLPEFRAAANCCDFQAEGLQENAIQNVAFGSFATESSKQQARPCPRCRRKQTQIPSVSDTATGPLSLRLAADGGN
jgi:uncharacterized protein with PIN domain